MVNGFSFLSDWLADFPADSYRN